MGAAQQESMNFDRILIKCGDFGRYQYLLLACFCFLNILCSMHFFTQTIISFVPDHWCYHEKLATKSFDEIAKIYKGFDNPSCTRLDDLNATHLTVSTKKCDRWIYKYDFGYRTMNTEMNWVCDDAYKARVGQSFFFVGSVVGSLLYGVISDKFGRLTGLVLSNMSACIGDFATIFTYDVYTFSAARLVSGMAADSNFYIMYILVLEYIRPSMRSVALNLAIGIFYTVGLMTTPWIAVAVGNWQYYLACTSLPLLAIIPIYFLVQESAQWLATRNDVDGSIKRLRRVAKMNGRNVPEADFDEYRKACQNAANPSESEKKHVTLFDMFRTPRMRKITIILFFKSMVITLCYDTVSRNVEGLGFSPLIMFSVSAIAVLPASLALVFLQDTIGRKGMASGSLLLAAVFIGVSGALIAYEKDVAGPYVLAALIIAGRFGVAIAFESGSQYATELIPTCVRGQGVAAVHVAGFGATFLSPYILLLGSYVQVAPSIILSILFIAGSYVCLLLPETLNRVLPNTLEEGEVFGLGEKMFEFPCISKKRNRCSSHSYDINPNGETYVKSHHRLSIIETLDMKPANI